MSFEFQLKDFVVHYLPVKNKENKKLKHAHMVSKLFRLSVQDGRIVEKHFFPKVFNLQFILFAKYLTIFHFRFSFFSVQDGRIVEKHFFPKVFNLQFILFAKYLTIFHFRFSFFFLRQL